MRDTFPEKRVDPDEKFQEVCEYAEEVLNEGEMTTKINYPDGAAQAIKLRLKNTPTLSSEELHLLISLVGILSMEDFRRVLSWKIAQESLSECKRHLEFVREAVDEWLPEVDNMPVMREATKPKDTNDPLDVVDELIEGLKQDPPVRPIITGPIVPQWSGDK